MSVKGERQMNDLVYAADTWKAWSSLSEGRL